MSDLINTSKPVLPPWLARFVTATAGRNMTRPAYLVVLIGVATMILLTVNPAYEAAHHGVDAILWACLAFFAFEWLVRIRHAVMSQRGPAYMTSFRGVTDGAAVLVVPAGMLLRAPAKTAWLLSVIWLVKVIPAVPGLRQLRRVLVLESGPLLSVAMIFLIVLFLGSVAVYFLEHDAQPGVFSNIPSALWWGGVAPTTPRRVYLGQ